MKKVILLVILSIIMMFSLFSQATSGRGKMSGFVYDEQTGKPLSGVTVKLYCLRARAYHTSTPISDSKGHWKALYLRGGMWNVDFEKVGYITKKISFNVETTPGRKKPQIEIKMRKMEGPGLEDMVIKEIEKAKVQMAENRIDEALTSLKNILEKYKESSGIAIVNLYVGNCYAQKDDFEKAVIYYKLAVKEYPKNKELLVSIGNAYNNLNQYDNAMLWFNKVPFDELDNINTLYNIGVIFYNKAKYDEAVKYFKKSTEINNEFADGFYQLGMTYTAQNKIPEALVALKRFMELDPESPNYQTAKAIVEAFSK
jgi:tetratricopeptide (TPR) repeat protein